MTIAIKYHHDNTIDTLPTSPLTTGDLSTFYGLTNYFNCVKDSQDNVYMFCRVKPGVSNSWAKIIKIDKNGNKTISVDIANNYIGNTDDHENISLTISRDENKLLFMGRVDSTNAKIFECPINTLIPTEKFNTSFSLNSKMEVYKNRYIWVKEGGNLKILDYDSGVVMGSVSIGGGGKIQMVVDASNTIYITDSLVAGLFKCTFDGLSTITANNIVSLDPSLHQGMILDSKGDLIMLTNDGQGSSVLLKYDTNGNFQKILDLYGSYYNLNIGANGKLYYSNALHTYEVPASTAQGSSFGTPALINNDGMVTNGNNIAGYYPGIQG